MFLFQRIGSVLFFGTGSIKKLAILAPLQSLPLWWRLPQSHPCPFERKNFYSLIPTVVKIFVCISVVFSNLDQAPFRHVKGKPGRGLQPSSSGKGKGNTKLKVCKREKERYIY